MKFVKKIIFTLGAILLLSIVGLLLLRSNNPEQCQSPTFLFNSANSLKPDAVVQALVEKLEGLPKTDMDIYAALDFQEPDTSLPVYPVATWTIDESWVTAPPDIADLWDDDPVLGHTILFDVTYEDGDTQALSWSSWYYGRVACPFVFTEGSGPPGYLEVQE